MVVQLPGRGEGRRAGGADQFDGTVSDTVSLHQFVSLESFATTSLTQVREQVWVAEGRRG